MSVPIVVRGGILAENGTELPVDTFGRVRVSDPSTMVQTTSVSLLPSLRPQQIYAMVNHTQGSGAIQTDVSGSVVRLSVQGEGAAVRQTRLYVPYQPGKSRLVLISAALSAPGGHADALACSRLGIFDDFAPAEHRFGDGHFFELQGAGGLSVVERSSAGGGGGEQQGPQEVRVPREAWNGDRLDGTGPSRAVLDTGAMQIYWIDVEWLGVGDVRMGVVVGNVYVRCHTFSHMNALTASYTRTPKLPVRHEIASPGPGPAPLSSLTAGCATVISEGGFVPRGVSVSLGRTLSGTALKNVDKTALALALRKEGYVPRATLVPELVELVVEDNRALSWQLRVDHAGANAVPAGHWENVDAVHSAARFVDGAAHALTVPAGTVAIAEGIMLGRSSASVRFDSMQGMEGQPFLAADYAGMPDTLYLVLRPLGNQDVVYYANLRWNEIHV